MVWWSGYLQAIKIQKLIQDTFGVILCGKCKTRRCNFMPAALWAMALSICEVLLMIRYCVHACLVCGCSDCLQVYDVLVIEGNGKQEIHDKCYAFSLLNHFKTDLQMQGQVRLRFCQRWWYCFWSNFLIYCSMELENATAIRHPQLQYLNSGRL